jgi:hypothetical protein
MRVATASQAGCDGAATDAATPPQPSPTGERLRAQHRFPYRLRTVPHDRVPPSEPQGASGTSIAPAPLATMHCSCPALADAHPRRHQSVVRRATTRVWPPARTGPTIGSRSDGIRLNNEYRTSARKSHRHTSIRTARLSRRRNGPQRTLNSAETLPAWRVRRRILPRLGPQQGLSPSFGPFCDTMPAPSELDAGSVRMLVWRCAL